MQPPGRNARAGEAALTSAAALAAAALLVVASRLAAVPYVVRRKPERHLQWPRQQDRDVTGTVILQHASINEAWPIMVAKGSFQPGGETSGDVL